MIFKMNYVFSPTSTKVPFDHALQHEVPHHVEHQPNDDDDEEDTLQVLFN